MDRPDFLTAAKNSLKKHYPDALCAFVAGSILRHEATATSDIDIIVLYDDTFQDIHRNSVIEDGWPIEFFVHNRRANDYFINKDHQSGRCLVAHMLITGIALPHECAFTQERRSAAQAAIDGGPPHLTHSELETRRYFITDSVDDLDPHKPSIERYGTLSRLYEQLGDLFLRGQGKWSGLGKSLGRLIRQHDPVFATRFEKAFASAYLNDFTAVTKLVDEVLAAYGGRLFAGYKNAAPDEWKTFT